MIRKILTWLRRRRTKIRILTKNEFAIMYAIRATGSTAADIAAGPGFPGAGNRALIYHDLARLEQFGLIRSAWAGPRMERGWLQGSAFTARRRLYFVTFDGENAIRGYIHAIKTA